MSKISLNKPNIERQLVNGIKDELFALRALIGFHRYMSLLLVIGLVVFIYEIRPLPPRTVTIATGQPQSTYDELGGWYKIFFKQHGIDLQLVPTNGALDNLKLLADKKVDAAFSQGGVPVPDKNKIISLGSIQLEPLWLFYRGEPLKGETALEFLQRKNVSIGIEGSGTHHIVLDVAAQYKIDVKKHGNLVELATHDAIKALVSGKIDGMFFLASPDTKAMQVLLEDPEIKVWDFTTARAIATKIHHAYAVDFPAGAIGLSPARPAQDIHMIATNTKILAPEDMHPAIQYLFLMAGSSFYNNTHVLFDHPSGFPTFLDHDVPKSDVAVKYLSRGSLALEHTFPFWVASFIDRAWLLLAALFAIIYPLSQMAPQYRKFHFRADLGDRYGDLRRIEAQLNQASSLADVEDAKRAFTLMEDNLSRTWVPAGAKIDYYNFLQAADVIRARIDRFESKYQAEN